MPILSDIGLWLDSHNWGGSFEKAMARYEQLQSNWALLMHGGESHRVRPYSPRTKIIQRENDKDGLGRCIPGDGHYEKPQDYANRRFKQVNEADYILPFNEIPSLKNSEHLKWWSTWCLGFMEICVSQGRRAAIGTIPVTTLEPQHWKGLHPVLSFISAHDDQFVFTITGYSNGIMPSGVNGTYPPNFKDDKGKLLPAADWYRFNPAEWPKEVDLTRRQWIAARIADMIVSMQNAGEDPPPTAVIEDGVDDVDDNVVQQWTKTLLRRATYNECKGWRSYKNQYEEWIKGFPKPYNGLSWQEYHAYGRLWQRDVVHRPFRRKNGDCVVQSSLDFLCSTDPNWERHFNMMSDEAAAYWRVIVEDIHNPLDLPWRIPKDNKPMFPLPSDPKWIEHTNESGSDYRIRPEAGTRLAETGWIRAGEKFSIYPDGEVENWRIGKNVAGVTGYVDAGVLEKKLPPAPLPAFDFADVLARLKQDLDSLAINIKSKGEQLSDANHVVARLDAELKLLETTRKDIAETVKVIEQYQQTVLEPIGG